MPRESTGPAALWLLTAAAARPDPRGVRSVAANSFGTTIWAALTSEGYRPARVAGLLAGVVLLSLGDLYMTLVHLLNFGMLEANPVARQIMMHGSPAALIIWKLLTVGFAVLVMFCARRRIAAEIGAVFCCFILAWLTLQWASYSDQVSRLTRELHSLDRFSDARWVTMVPDESM